MCIFQTNLDQGIFSLNMNTDILSLIFMKVPLERLTVIPIVCKNWRNFIQKQYGKIFDINLLAQSILEKKALPKSLKKFISQHKKSQFDQILHGDRFFQEIAFCWQDAVESAQFEYYTCFADNEPRMFCVTRKAWKNTYQVDSKGQIGDLRIRVLLNFHETTKILSNHPNDRTSGWIDSVCIYRTIKHHVQVHETMEKVTLKGWKKVSLFQKSKTINPKYSTIIKELLTHIEFFFKSVSVQSARYNCALLENRKIEDFEPFQTFYANSRGRIVQSSIMQSPGYKFNIVVSSIKARDGKLIKVLSWKPINDGFGWCTGFHSAMRYAALSKTTHMLSRRYGLPVFKESKNNESYVQFPQI